MTTALTGNEQLIVTGVSGTGGLAGSGFPTTTGAIAALGGGGGTGSTTQLTATGITSNAEFGSTLLPANAFLLYGLFRETAGETVSVSIGTSLDASDVMSAVSVPASGTISATTLSFAKVWFSHSSTQELFLTSASWNGASVNAYLVYQVGP